MGPGGRCPQTSPCLQHLCTPTQRGKSLSGETPTCLEIWGAVTAWGTVGGPRDGNKPCPFILQLALSRVLERVCVCAYTRVHGCAPGILGVPAVGWIHLVGLVVQGARVPGCR